MVQEAVHRALPVAHDHGVGEDAGRLGIERRGEPAGDDEGIPAAGGGTILAERGDPARGEDRGDVQKVVLVGEGNGDDVERG
jgi:hypothetical protein